MRASRVHIGEVARRTGVSAAVLRAWETRYGLLDPERSDGGTRLYSVGDIARVGEMQRLIAQGVPAAQAAQTLLATEGRPDAGLAPTVPGAPRSDESGLTEMAAGAERLATAMVRLDRAAAETTIDAMLAWAPVDQLIAGVIIPYLEDVGQRWARGETGIAEEHLATNILRGRFLGLARHSHPLHRQPIVLACPPGERHDLPLVLLMVLLRNHRPAILLGADTPLETTIEAARTVDAAGVVLSATADAPPGGATELITEISRRWPLYIGGRGASAELADRFNASFLADLVDSVNVIS